MVRHTIRRIASMAAVLAVCIAPLSAAWSGVASAQTLPTLSIEDVALPEGGEGDVTLFEFRVLLSEPAPPEGVRFDLATRHGTAGDTDYEAQDWLFLYMGEGETETSVSVAVLGDRSREQDETFFLEISNLSGANVANSTATGTILNDDLITQVYARDASVREGDSGQTLVSVRIELDAALDEEVRVSYETAPGSARPGEDYVNATGDLVFAPGERTKTVEIAVIGDTLDEPTEYFHVGFYDLVGVEYGGDARIEIITDDAGQYSIRPASLADGRVGERYDQGFYLDAYPGARFVISGALPPGVEYTYFAPNGRWYLLGFPTTPGTYPIEVVAYANATSNQSVAYRSYVITIADHGLTLPATTLPNASFREDYELVLNPASGGTAPYRYAVTAGALPEGVVLEQNGRLVGRPETTGDYAFTISVTDSSPGGPFTAARDYTLFVAAPELAITTDEPLAGRVGVELWVRFLVPGIYTPPLSFRVARGALPGGLTLNADGELSGIPQTAGEFPIVLEVADSTESLPARVQSFFVIRIEPPTLRLQSPPRFEGVVGRPFDRDGLVPIGGVAPYTIEIASGALPSGMTLGQDGLFRGVPEEAGDFPITIYIGDSTPTGVLELWHQTVIRILPSGLAVTPSQLPSAREARAYALSLQTEGGLAPYRYALESGALPPGMSLSEAGELSGAPQSAGEFAFEIRVSDASDPVAPKTAVVPFTLRVEDAVLLLEPEALPPGVVGTPWRAQLRVTGGAAPYVYRVAAGNLPPGLALVNDEILGTPTAAGTYDVDIEAADSAAGTPRRVVRAYSLVIDAASGAEAGVAAPGIVIGPETLPDGVAALPYAETLSVSGGTAPYRFAVTAGALPAGLSLDATTGGFAGTPKATASFTITATDALGFTGTRDYTLEVIERPDPTQDAEVRGLLNAQTAAMRRFAEAQTENFQQRMETLHRGGERGGGGGFDNALGFSLRQHCVQQTGAMESGARPGESCRQGDNADGPSAGDSAFGSGSLSADERGGSQDDEGGPISLWVSGTLRSGNQDGRGGGGGVDFETDGISVGADYRFSPSFVLGGGLGYGRDESRVGEAGSRIDGEATTAAIYASWHPGEVFYLDTLFGIQRLDYELRRRITFNGNLVRGQRDGEQWFASVSAGGEFANEAWMWVPYGRLDVARATLDSYSETGDPLLALRYESMDVDTTTGSVGLRVDYRKKTTWGMFSPQLRLEYQHDFDADADAGIRYADGLDPFYRADVTGYERNRFVFGLGALFRTETDWTFRLEYRGLIDGEDRDNGFLLNVEKQY